MHCTGSGEMVMVVRGDGGDDNSSLSVHFNRDEVCYSISKAIAGDVVY